MKKINSLYLILAITLLFTSCQKNDNTLIDLIPTNSSFVGYFDTKQMAEKADCNLFETPTVMQGINFAKAMIKNPESIKAIDDFVKDPNSIGMDFKGVFYVFSNIETTGVVFSVNNADLLKTNFKNISELSNSDIESENGIYYYNPIGNSIIVCWDNARFLMLFNSGNNIDNSGKLDIKDRAFELFKQTGNNSLNQNDSFKKFMSNKADIAYYSSTAGLFSLANIANDKIKNLLDGDLDFIKDINSGTYINFNKGAINFNTKLLFANAKSENKYNEFQSKMSGVINEKNLPYIPSSSALAMTFNLNGRNIYDFIEKLGLDELIDEQMSFSRSELLEALADNTKGNITFNLIGFSDNANKDNHHFSYDYYEDIVPLFSLFSKQIDGGILMKSIKEILHDEDIKDEKNGNISVVKNNIKFYFGLSNDNFFVTNDENTYQRIIGNENQYNNYYNSLTSKSISIVEGDFDFFKTLVNSYSTANDPKIYVVVKFMETFLSLFESYSFGTTTSGSATGEIIMKDKSQNSLNSICKEIDSQLSKGLPF